MGHVHPGSDFPPATCHEDWQVDHHPEATVMINDSGYQIPYDMSSVLVLFLIQATMGEFVLKQLSAFSVWSLGGRGNIIVGVLFRCCHVLMLR